MHWPIRAHWRFVLAIGVAVVVLGCSAPGASPAASPTPSASPAASPTTAVSQAASPSPVAAATATATPIVTPAASRSPAAAASAPDGMLESTTLPSNSAPTGAIQLEMFGPPPQFRPKDLTGTASETVTFYLVNNSPAREEHGTHTLAIGKKLGEPLVVSAELKGGQRAIFSVHGLGRGTYVIWCSLFGHAGLGQVGTLTLK